MTQENIYQPPQSDVMEVSDQAALASRWARLFASILDSIILGIVVLPVAFALGLFDDLASGNEPGLMFTLIAAMLSIVVFVVLNGHLLANHGQTIGKKIFKIRIVDMNGQRLDFGKLMGLRYLPLWIATYLPIVGTFLPLIDGLFIFRSDKRCAHDLIAGTQVVNA